MQTDPFEEYRSLLFALAYRMLGSSMEAEDIVQEAYLSYRATPPESIRTLKSFLTTIVHHLCINHLKSARQHRENYVGPWLPEPIITSPADGNRLRTCPRTSIWSDRSYSGSNPLTVTNVGW